MLVGIIAYSKSPGEQKTDNRTKKMPERRVSFIYREKAGRDTAFFLSVGTENAEMYFRKA
jgi:hypothetical protein